MTLGRNLKFYPFIGESVDNLCKLAQSSVDMTKLAYFCAVRKNELGPQKGWVKNCENLQRKSLI